MRSRKKCVSSRYITCSVCQNNRDSRGQERAAAAVASLRSSRTKVEQSKLVSSIPPTYAYLRPAARELLGVLSSAPPKHVVPYSRGVFSMLLLIPFSGFPALSTCLVGLRQATRTKRQCIYMKKKKKKEKREIVVVMAIMTGGCLSDSQFHFHSPPSTLCSPVPLNIKTPMHPISPQLRLRFRIERITHPSFASSSSFSLSSLSHTPDLFFFPLFPFFPSFEFRPKLHTMRPFTLLLAIGVMAITGTSGQESESGDVTHTWTYTIPHIDRCGSSLSGHVSCPGVGVERYYYRCCVSSACSGYPPPLVDRDMLCIY